MDTIYILWGIAACCALLIGGSAYALLYLRRTTGPGNHDTIHYNETSTAPAVKPVQQPEPPASSAVSPIQTAPMEQLEHCSRMAGVFAHDFNNIMTAIGGYTSLLQKRLADDERAKRYINGIIEAEKHASELLDRLALVANSDTRHISAIDVNKIIREVCAELATHPGEVEVIPPAANSEPVLTRGDPDHFRRTIVNLGFNAIEACGDSGGTVRFFTEITDPAQSTLPSSLAPGTYLHIGVTDTGCGMNENVRSHLFEPFFSTKPKGKSSGLGLSIVWRYVLTCHGTVEFESTPGSGTTFHVYLPQLAEPTQADTPHEHTAPEASLSATGQASVLVVDDELSVREIYTEILEDHGYTVTSCSNGREACDFVNRGTPVDLVLLDLMMPVMDGIETFSVLRDSHPTMKILFMSGFHTTETIGNLLAQPATDFFEKPGNSDLLLSKITTLLGKN
ncbi:MAG: response regulator [Chitinispirillaceae bacterium]|nr:response regulator [Chitinispirillaceae bacterium]